MHTINSSLQHFFGVDVAKAELVIHRFGERAVHALPNATTVLVNTVRSVSPVRGRAM